MNNTLNVKELRFGSIVWCEIPDAEGIFCRFYVILAREFTKGGLIHTLLEFTPNQNQLDEIMVEGTTLEFKPQVYFIHTNMKIANSELKRWFIFDVEAISPESVAGLIASTSTNIDVHRLIELGQKSFEKEDYTYPIQ